jgi:ribokinase
MASLYPDMDIQQIALALYEEYQKPVILSDGANGAFFVERGRLVHQKTYPLKEVSDTVGAGDSFHGGVVFALVSGQSLAEAVDMGNACGAMNCLAFGARSGMATLEKVREFKEVHHHGHGDPFEKRECCLIYR